VKSLTRFSSSLVAFLNAYGYLRFGQEGFERESDRFSIPTKLAQMLRHPFVQTFEDDCEIVSVLKSLASRRNRLVQLRPELHVLAADGTRFETTKRLPPDDSQSAIAAVQEMERFFELFAQIDPYLGRLAS